MLLNSLQKLQNQKRVIPAVIAEPTDNEQEFSALLSELNQF